MAESEETWEERWGLKDYSFDDQQAWMRAVFMPEARRRVAIDVSKKFLKGPRKIDLEEFDWPEFSEAWIEGAFFGDPMKYLDERAQAENWDFIERINRIGRLWENRWADFYSGGSLDAGFRVHVPRIMWNYVDAGEPLNDPGRKETIGSLAEYVRNPPTGWTLLEFSRKDVIDNADESIRRQDSGTGKQWGQKNGSCNLSGRFWKELTGVFIEAGRK